MRRALLVSLLFLSACASATSGARPRLGIAILGPRNAALLGQQSFVVQITNRSTMTVMIKTIRVDLAAFGSAFNMVDNSETVDTEIRPDETVDFDMSPSVVGGRGDGSGVTMSGRIESLRVDISGQSEYGPFYDGGTYPVVAR